jgi:uncharacterized cupredoxin-like copper-binding protein
MKRWLILVVGLLIWGIALTACGSDSQGTNSASSNSAGSSSSGTSSSGTSSQSSGAHDVHIVMAEMTIKSDVTTFTQGVPYHFIIENKGTMQHEFEIAKNQPLNATEEQMDSGRLAELARLDPGKTGTLDYTFTSAYPAGTMRLVCGMPGHYSAGQYTDIVVE